MPLDRLNSFLLGILGAFFIYLAIFREKRLKYVIAYPKKNWRMLIFDLLIYLICGGIFAAFFIEPKTIKEAVFAGATWQGVAAGLLRKAIEEVK